MESVAGMRINRIRAKDAVAFRELGGALAPERLHAALPRTALTEEARTEKANLVHTLQTFASYTKAGGFDPTRTFQYVANIDQSVWATILDLFAAYDPDTGELVSDGLLYKTDLRTNKPTINKEFFYALLGYLEESGYKCDMRAKLIV